MTNSGETVVKKDPPLVSDKIIDVSKIESKIANENGSEFKKYSDGKFIVAHGNYNISSPEKGLLVATGDVTVNANFEGLILCCGKVTVNGNCELKHNMIMVGNILEEIEKDTENPEYAKFFKAFNGEYTEDPTALEDCVSYQNWVKNG